MRYRSVLIWTMLMLVPALAQDASPPVASATDCAVLAAVTGAGSGSLFDNSFGANCDWKAMGVRIEIVPHPEGQYYEGLRIFFSRPEYSSDGNSAKVTTGIGGNRSEREYFSSSSYCSAEKRNGKWVSKGCRPGPIT